MIILPAAGYDVEIHMAYGEIIAGYVNPIKTTADALAVMVRNRKTPKMVAVAEIVGWHPIH